MDDMFARLPPSDINLPVSSCVRYLCNLFHSFCVGLYNSLYQSFARSKLPEPDDLMQVARDFSCDGCFEPMFTGRTEFKFAYIFLLKVSR